jgi:hypothetical protein
MTNTDAEDKVDVSDSHSHGGSYHAHLQTLRLASQLIYDLYQLTIATSH